MTLRIAPDIAVPVLPTVLHRGRSGPERLAPCATVPDPPPAVEVGPVAGERGPGSIQRLDAHLIVVPLAGASSHLVDFEPYRIGPGRLLHVRPGQVHRREAPGDGEDLELRVPAELGPSGLFPPGCYDPVPGPEVTAVVETVVADLEAQWIDRADPRLLAAGGSYVLLRLAQAMRPPPGAGSGQGDLVAALLAAIESSFSDTRAVADYARELGASARTLSRATGALLGCSPKELIDRRVGLEARRLLAVTTLPVAEVADRLGFTEATNFTKFFVRHTEEGPLEFRVAC